MAKIITDQRFLGRKYDHKTDSYFYRDGSGATITSEQKEDAMSEENSFLLISIWKFLN